MQIDDASANDVMAQLLTLESNDPDRDISMYINSPGGSFTALTAIYDTMQFVRPDIQTVCMGQAASAAAVLLAAGTPGKRAGAAEHARVLIHQPSSERARARSPTWRSQADEILRMRAQLEEILARHTGQPEERVRARHRAGQDPHRRGGQEYGFIDRRHPTRKLSSAQRRLSDLLGADAGPVRRPGARGRPGDRRGTGRGAPEGGCTGGGGGSVNERTGSAARCPRRRGS